MNVLPKHAPKSGSVQYAGALDAGQIKLFTIGRCREGGFVIHSVGKENRRGEANGGLGPSSAVFSGGHNVESTKWMRAPLISNTADFRLFR